MSLPKPPKSLEKARKSFWNKIVSTYELGEHHFRLLEADCQCLDRIESARAEVAKTGQYYKDRWKQPKEHPGIAAERNQKVLFARLMRELCLDAVETAENRPPELY
jgi:phage terminase small subunit